jgi:uncharacterized membrane protein YgaE (UPF0421/DUF939 family)
MDWSTLFVSALVQALVGAGTGFFFWLFIQRQVEKYDRLTQRLDDLEEKRIAGIESAAKEHGQANEDEKDKNAARRKEIYERLAKVERESVTAAKCHEKHQEERAGLLEYRAAVIDLAKVQEKLFGTANFLDEVNERVISLKEDVARMQGEQHGRG